MYLVPMLQRGNAYYIGSHAGAWEPGKGFRFGLTLKAGRKSFYNLNPEYPVNPVKKIIAR